MGNSHSSSPASRRFPGSNSSNSISTQSSASSVSEESRSVSESPGVTHPPSLATAASIAAHQRLLEELHRLEQNQRERTNSLRRSSLSSSETEGEEEEVGVNISTNFLSGESGLVRRLRRLLDSGELRLLRNHRHQPLTATHEPRRPVRFLNMLSDHNSSDDESVVEEPRSSTVVNRSFAGLMTIPRPDLSKSHESYNDFRHDVMARAGLEADCDVALLPSKDYVANEDALFQPSSSSIRSVMRNVKLGLGPSIGPGRRCMKSCISTSAAMPDSVFVSCRNQMTPNRRKIVDRLHAKTFCVSYVSDGHGLVTASQDNRIRIYEQRSAYRRYVCNSVVEIPFMGWSILDMATSPDGRHVVYSTWNNVLYQMDLQDEHGGWRDMPFDADNNRFGVFSVKFDPSGTEIAAGTTSGLYIYNREADRCVLRIDGHEDDVNAVCFADQSSNLILSSGDDGLIKMWDRRSLTSPKPVAVFAGHRDGVVYIDNRGDDRYFLTNSKDQSIKVWDMRLHSDDNGINATRHSVRNQKWDYRWQYLPASRFKTTNLPGDASILTLRGHSVLHTLVRARFSPSHTGKRFIYTGCARGGCIVFDLYTGEVHKKYGGHKSVVRDCMWHPTDNELITSSWDGSVFVWRYDRRGPTTKNLDSDTQRILEDDSCDEFGDPLPQQPNEKERRIKSVSRRNLTSYGMVGPRLAARNRIEMKYAQVETDQTSSESDEETSYATVAKRANRPAAH